MFRSSQQPKSKTPSGVVSSHLGGCIKAYLQQLPLLTRLVNRTPTPSDPGHVHAVAQVVLACIVHACKEGDSTCSAPELKSAAACPTRQHLIAAVETDLCVANASRASLGNYWNKEGMSSDTSSCLLP